MTCPVGLAVKDRVLFQDDLDDGPWIRAGEADLKWPHGVQGISKCMSQEPVVKHRLFLLVVMALNPACTGAEEEENVEPGQLEPPPAGYGFQLEMTAHAPAYTEVWQCEVYDVATTEIAYVNWIEFTQNAGTHHMTLSTPSLGTEMEIENGSYDCNELYEATMDNWTMIYGNQGAEAGEMHLPDGVAASLPANLKILHELHYVNASDEGLDLYSRVNAWTLLESEVEEGIWGGSVRDENIAIPAQSEHTEWSRCVFNRDVEILFLASHTHELGTRFEIAPFDGTDVGEVFYTNEDWHDPMIVQYEDPIVVSAGEGFEWSCTWNNDCDEEIIYGLTAQDEMCNIAVVHTPFDTSAACEVVETSDGVLWE